MMYILSWLYLRIRGYRNLFTIAIRCPLSQGEEAAFWEPFVLRRGEYCTNRLQMIDKTAGGVGQQGAWAAAVVGSRTLGFNCLYRRSEKVFSHSSK